MASRLTQPERGSRGTFAAGLELVLEDRPTRPPKPPAWLAEEARPAFRALFRAAVAQTWRREDRHALARLAVLRTAVEAGDLRGTTLSALARLEAELLLSPKARRQARVRIDSVDGPATLHLLPSDPFAPDRIGARRALAEHGAEPLER